ncbi:MAG: M1 family metallopeptidase [Terriglobales bacterium]
MKRLSLFIATFLLVATAHARFIPDPIVRYKIDARLDADAKTIKGREVIVWKNHTSDTIPDLQFHLYLNAFKNNYSTFMREGGAESRRVRFRNRADAWGYQRVHQIKVDGADLTGKLEYIQPDDGNPNDQTVARVLLPKPIPPQGSVTIEIDWTSKLPRVFARTGFHDNFFLVAQWYPKPGVYEGPGDRHRTQGGWNCHQFHMNTEFYADFGTFDVNLTVPSSFEIAASGELKSEQQNPDGTTTYNFYHEDIHDFAWTTQPRSQAMKIVRWFNPDERVTPAEYDEWSRKTGTPLEEMKLTPVKVTLFIQREHLDQVDRHFRATFAGLKWFGLMYGRYPYDVVTVVDPGHDAAGGMEYPTFFTAGTDYWQSQRGGSPEGVTVHEFGHQFWYGLVANNEFEEAWLDEGFNTYSTAKTLQLEYGHFYNYERVFGVPVPAQSWLNVAVPRYPWHGVGEVPIGQYWEWVARGPYRGRIRSYHDDAQTDIMQRYAWLDLNRASYGTQAYAKPELTLHTLEALLGDAWPKVIRTYHQRYRFKHPDAQDFLTTVREVSGRDMTWFFQQTLYGAGMLNYEVSFSSGPAPLRTGFFDKNGTPELVESSGDKRPNESEVLVRRLGEMHFPVTVQVKFEDGSETREHWDGQYRWTKFYFPGKKVVFAAIDPDWQWKLEVHRTDDTYQAQPVRLAAEKWYLRWVVWLQNALLAFSYFA